MFRKEALQENFNYPFGDGAVRLIHAAGEEAKRFNHSFIGTEHLLLGYTQVGNREFLDINGITLQIIRDSVAYMIGRGDRLSRVNPTFTPAAERAINSGIAGAKTFAYQTLQADHIMIGLLTTEGIAAGIIDSVGLKRDELKANLLGIL